MLGRCRMDVDFLSTLYQRLRTSKLTFRSYRGGGGGLVFVCVHPSPLGKYLISLKNHAYLGSIEWTHVLKFTGTHFSALN